MLRHGSLAMLVLATNSFMVGATGNIGCLFSDTLCNRETEWCFDDKAFGLCLPLYGSVREKDMYRYELGAPELRMLERDMQRLNQLGYRWSHKYTQCVLKALLYSIRYRLEPDVSECNAKNDQDLEGALKAIEGEEMEHIDPRNLAIVRFTPSVMDPHSEYADELYYPPLPDLLSPFNPEDEQDAAAEEQQKFQRNTTKTEVDHPSEGNSGNPSLADKEPVGQRASFSLKAEGNPIEVSKQQSLHTDDADRSFDYDFGDYDLLLTEPIEVSRNGHDKRAPPFWDSGREHRRSYDVIGNIKKEYVDTDRDVGYDLRRLAELLIRFRPPPYEFYSDAEGERPAHYADTDPEEVSLDDSTKEHQPFSAQDDWLMQGDAPYLPPRRYSKDRDSEVYGKSVFHPSEEELAFRQSIGNDQYYTGPRQSPPADAFYDPFYDKANEEGGAARAAGLEPRLGNSVSQFIAEKAKGPKTGSTSHYDSNGGDKEGQQPLVHKQDADRNQLPSEGSYNGDQGDFFIPPYDYSPIFYYDDYPDYPLYGPPYYHSDPNYQGGFDKKDEEMMKSEEGEGEQPWNLQRNERVDVKKPGPFVNSKNNFAFDFDYGDYVHEPGQEHEWQGQKPRPKGAFLLPGMFARGPFRHRIQGGPDYLADTVAEVPDLVLTDEGFVDSLGREPGGAAPKEHHHVPSASQVASTKTGGTQKSSNTSDSFVYITINGRFTSRKQGKDLVQVILRLAGMDYTDIQNLSVGEDQVMFQIKKNSRGITSAHVAEMTEELRDTISKEAGVEVRQAGVGTKNAQSPVVYNSSQRQVLAAAAIVCGVCAALLVAATALFFLRRRAKSKAKLQGLAAHDSEASKDYQDLCRARMAGKTDSGKGDAVPTTPSQVHTTGVHAPGQRVSSLSRESDNGKDSPSSRSSTSSWSEEPVVTNMDISTGHMVLSYMEDHLKNKDRLEQEWIALCAYEAEPCSTLIALKPENARKNRFAYAVPYDHNRVVLNDHANVSGSNFINASSITDHDPRNPAYIATQGPLAGTAADFWQLVWEQGSVVIVMLTRLTENGQALCHRYWPEEGSELYHIYEVHLVSEHIWCDDYLVRSFYLKNIRTGETRTVTQFHFLSWPDSGVPASIKALLEFRRKVNKSYRGRSCPIIVHCSDGVGRTGTYILIDMVLNRMAKGAKEIDIAATLEHIRDQRPSMVKTKIQFEFVLMAVAEEVHAILRALPQ